MKQAIQTASEFCWERSGLSDPDALERAAGIVRDVRCGGDARLVAWTTELDGVNPLTYRIRVAESELAEAYRAMDGTVKEALGAAADRIRRFHEAQWPEDFTLYGEDGEQMGLVWRSLRRVGVYAPGGRNAYPSTVLMDVIPAQVAGVRSIALASPPGLDGRPHQAVLAAAYLLGVEEVYAIGGAQAIAALAYGSESVERVDKIVGPGNQYVAMAKRLVMGDVGIDSVAGPSEVFIVADDTARADWIAADMLAQAEHDPLAGAVCVSPSRRLLEAVATELDRQIQSLPRHDIAEASLRVYGALVHVEDLPQAIAVVNQAAPEHVEILTEQPDRVLPEIQSAGAVFLGQDTPEPVGDYFAGPNHVLPTHGSARYASGLGVHDFLRRMSVVAYSSGALAAQGPAIVTLARAEGLEAHARAIEIRTGGEPR